MNSGRRGRRSAVAFVPKFHLLVHSEQVNGLVNEHVNTVLVLPVARHMGADALPSSFFPLTLCLLLGLFLTQLVDGLRAYVWFRPEVGSTPADSLGSAEIGGADDGECGGALFLR